MGRRVFERWVDDRLIPVELDRDEMLSPSADLATEAGMVASYIGLVAELVADYMRRVAHADAEYRQWRARRFIALKGQGGSKPPSDDTTSKLVEGEDDFVRHKAAIAELESDLEYLRGMFEALRAKASLCRARADVTRGKEYGEAGGFDLRRVDGDAVKTAMTRGR